MQAEGQQSNPLIIFHARYIRQQLVGNEHLLAVNITNFTRHAQSYTLHLNKLKNFRENHCPEVPDLLNALSDPVVANLLNNEQLKDDFLALVKSLAELSDRFPNNNTPQPELLRQALIEGILLTNNFTTVRYAHSSEKEEELLNQMIALTANIKALTQFAKKPNDEKKKQDLLDATEAMIYSYDATYRIHENRWFYRFIASVILILCCAAWLLANTMVPQPTTLFPFITFITAPFVITGSIVALIFSTSTLSSNQKDAFSFRATVKEYCANPNRLFSVRGVAQSNVVQPDPEQPGMVSQPA